MPVDQESRGMLFIAFWEMFLNDLLDIADVSVRREKLQTSTSLVSADHCCRPGLTF